MQTISKVRIKVQETKAQKISAKDLEKILLKHFSDLMSGFYEMQTSFLSGIYKRYGNTLFHENHEFHMFS